MMVSSSARRLEGDPKTDDAVRRGVCGLEGPDCAAGEWLPPVRMLETVRCNGPEAIPGNFQSSQGSLQFRLVQN